MGSPEAEHQNYFTSYDHSYYSNKYTIGQFNINGWFSVRNPYFNIFKVAILTNLNVDIIVLCETHCHNDDLISLDNYTIFQHNRLTGGGERRGSGGIAICIKNSLLFTHEVAGLYAHYDGILGVRLRHRFTEYSIGIMGNYLSPSNYQYGRDPEGYFNNCAAIWDTLADCDLRVAAGDYNSRTAQVLDYLPDIDGDLIPPRTNPDNIKNSHGDCFISFLKENRTIILNGRVTPHYNNYTFVSPRGVSVPDYIVCPVDNLTNCKSFQVLLMTDIVNMFGLLPPQTLPDHSFLIATFSTTTSGTTQSIPAPATPEFSVPKRKAKKNLNKIDSTFFMSDEITTQVLETIRKLELINKNQQEIDRIWGEVKGLFLNEMSKLPDLPTSKNKKNNRHFKKSQPFWNDELRSIWREVCRTEREYLQFKVTENGQLLQKQILRLNFKNYQKLFDKKFRYFKRQYNKKRFLELSESASTNPADMWAKLKRLCDPPSTRAALEIVRTDGTISTDMREILDRWVRDIARLFSGLRNNPDMVFNDQFYQDVLNKKIEFDNLSPEMQESASIYNSASLNFNLSFEEVSKAIDSTKNRKAYLELPNEITKNKNAKALLHSFFNLCFISGLNPTEWDFSNIKPIPKKDKDPRDPLNNRCITIICCIAKIYSRILNNRLQKYLEQNEILVAEQNGFRATRSCIDHIYALCTILRNRKEMGLETFLAFIDFQKAFDSVDRNLLLYKLSKIGISGHFYKAISSLYSNPRSRVILNEYETDYFDCPIGVKQGDCLSPTLFAIFINDLAEIIKNSGVGLDLDQDTFLNILLYADDIVLMAKNELDLQFLLFLVETWCKNWRLEVNLAKTNILHVRKVRKPRSQFMFIFDKRPVPYCDSYKYLGCSINENLNFNFTVNCLADSAGRALGSIITKMIKNGGFPYNVFCILYDACVCSILEYGGEIFGYDFYESALQIYLRGGRSFLGVPKNASTHGIISEMNQLLPQSRSQIRMIRQYHRLLNTKSANVCKQVFLWDKKLNEDNIIHTWYNEVKNIFSVNGQGLVFQSGLTFPLKDVIDSLKSSMIKIQQTEVQIECNQKPKLRTFVQFKIFSETPSYLTKPLSFIQRKFLAKLRLGCLELRLETGRWVRPKIPELDRICLVCENQEKNIENENHFLFICPKYSQERETWLQKMVIPANFSQLPETEKFQLVLNNPENVKNTAQYVINIFEIRSKVVNKLPVYKPFHLVPHDQCPACHPVQ